MPRPDLQPLVQLGFTNLESEIYAFLVENSPATGYGIAKGISKPAANTYKALESLSQKGAVVIDDDQTRLFRAVDAEELLEGFERRFGLLRGQAEAALKKLKPSPKDKRVYQLQTIHLVFSRYRKMLSECQRVVMLDLFPLAFKELRPDILAAAKRGVKVTVKLYEPCQLKGVKVVLQEDREATLKKWPGQWANGFFDGEQYLLAYLSKDGRQVRQAIWSNNQYLAWVYYQGFVHELMVSELESGLNANLEIPELKRIAKKYRKYLKLEATGYKDAAVFFEK